MISPVAARSWFDIPNNGQMVDISPVYKRYPHAKVKIKLDMITPGIHFLS